MNYSSNVLKMYFVCSALAYDFFRLVSSHHRGYNDYDWSFERSLETSEVSVTFLENHSIEKGFKNCLPHSNFLSTLLSSASSHTPSQCRLIAEIIFSKMARACTSESRKL